MRIQTIPNFIASENRLCLTRIRWEHGKVGDGGYSSKVSISLQWKPQDLWIGAFWKHDFQTLTVWICLLPCLPIRIKRVWSFGGIFP